MSVLWRFTRRAVGARPGRALLTLLSIVIGVSAVVAVNVATVTTRGAYKEMYESVTGRAALEVVAEGGGAYEEATAAALESVAGVRAVVPAMQQPSILYFKGSRVRLLAMGIDPERDDLVRDYELQAGELLGATSGAMMEIGFARSLGIDVGDEVRLLTRRGVKRVAVVGLLSPRGAASFNQGGIVFLPLELAQSYFARAGQINIASIVLHESSDEEDVLREVSALLPAGLIARPPAARSQLAKETMEEADEGLRLAYTMTLVLGAFIILNTFLMNVGERRKQLAILRAIGATQGQVVRMLLFEALLMGLVGTVIGTAVGLGAAMALAAGMARAFSTPTPAIQITLAPFVNALLIGPGISLLAAYLPARLAGKVSPLEGMRPAIVEESKPASLRYILVSLTAFFSSGGLMTAAVLGYLPKPLAVPFGVAFTASFVMLIPPVLPPLARAAAWLLRPLLRTEGRLACRQILRRRARTTLTIGVLYMAVGTGIQMGTAIINNVNDVRDWQRRTIVGDFFIRALFPDMATGQATEMPESLGAEIRAVGGVRSVDTLRFVSAHVGEQPVVAVLREFTGPSGLPLDLREGDADAVRQALFRGEVVIGSVLAKKLGLNVGDSLPLKTRDGERLLKISGLTTEYMVGGMIVHLERTAGKRLLGVEGVDAFMIQAEPTRLGDVEAQLKDLAERQGLMLHSFADLRRRLDGIMNGVVASLWGLLFLGFIVAGFGIANTLTMNVLEQTRELAMLRVVSMTRQQIRKTILAQATIIGVIGLSAGAIGGVLGALIVNYSAYFVLGRSVAFQLDPLLMAGALGLAFLIILVAAWIPAERAARLNLLLALQYE